MTNIHKNKCICLVHTLTTLHMMYSRNVADRHYPKTVFKIMLHISESSNKIQNVASIYPLFGVPQM